MKQKSNDWVPPTTSIWLKYFVILQIQSSYAFKKTNGFGINPRFAYYSDIYKLYTTVLSKSLPKHNMVKLDFDGKNREKDSSLD